MILSLSFLHKCTAYIRVNVYVDSYMLASETNIEHLHGELESNKANIIPNWKYI